MSLTDLPLELRIFVYREMGLDDIDEYDLRLPISTTSAGGAKSLRATSRQFRDEVNAYLAKHSTLHVRTFSTFVKLARVYDTFTRHCSSLSLKLRPFFMALILGDGIRDAEFWTQQARKTVVENVSKEMVYARRCHTCRPECFCRYLLDFASGHPTSRFANFLALRRLDVIWLSDTPANGAEQRFFSDLHTMLARIDRVGRPASLETVRFGSLHDDEDEVCKWQTHTLGPPFGHALPTPFRAADWKTPPEPPSESERISRHQAYESNDSLYTTRS